MGSSIYRPPNWNSASFSPLIITFPGQTNQPQYSPNGVTATLPSITTYYAFDAVIRAEHQQRLQKTEHPVQTGANISDHAYLMPARLVADVAMSDAIDAYIEGSWSGSQSKSVSAFQTMLALQFSRVPLVVSTRLRIYSNMVIEDINAEETASTFAGLRLRTVTFGEILTATTQQVPVSSRPHATQTSQTGNVTPTSPTPSQTSQHNVGTFIGSSGINAPGAAGNTINWNAQGPVDTPGAGTWTSGQNVNLMNLPAPK